MDERRFDLLTRAISTSTSRRNALGLVLAGATFGIKPQRVKAIQGDSAIGCAPDQTDCNGVCVDTCCNNQNCGSCGNICPPGLTCFEGICDCPSGPCCAEGEVICNGACVATCCDNANCGTCGNVCAGGLTCFEGKCDCPSGLCPPEKLPSTGMGMSHDEKAAMPWAALVAVAGTAAMSVVGWARGDSRSAQTFNRHG